MLTIDILIFVVFFLLNIIVGFKYRGKKQSFREFAIGDRKFSTATLTATLVATFMSGSVFFVGLENTYGKGLYYALATLIGGTAGLLITGRVIGPRMGRFLDHVSLPDALGKLYGKSVQLIAGISCVFLSIGYIAVQFKIMAKILAIVFNYESPIVVIIAATIVTLYSLSGGVKAVTFTDILQFFTFGTLLPVLSLTIWNNLQDQSQVVYILKTNPLFSLKEVIGCSPQFGETLALMTYFAIPELAPELFQRIAMARDTTQVRQSMTWAAIICLGLKLCIMWIAILLLTDQSGLMSQEIVPYMVNTHLHTGLKGFLGIGVIALSMSTADSTINATAVIIANDILPPLKLQKAGSLKAAKNATLFLGIFALLLALYIQGLLDIILFSACFYAPIVIVPMLLAVFGFQTSRGVVLLAMGVGAATVTACLITSQSVNSFLPGLLANLVTMLSLHYLLGEEGGWQRLDPTSPLALERAAQKQAWQRRLYTVRNFKLYPYLQQNLPTHDSFYCYFALYAMVATYIALYIGDPTHHNTYRAIHSIIYHTVFPITTAFITFPLWPAKIKQHPFIAYCWPLGIGGILFFVGTLLVVMSDFHYIQVMVMMINLLMAVLLLQWPLALFLAFTGAYAAVAYFTHWTGMPLTISTLGSIQMLYLFLLFTSLLIALKGRQVYRGLAASHALLKTENNFASHIILAMARHRASILQEASGFFLHAGKPTPKLQDPVSIFNPDPSKEQLRVENEALHQYNYQLDTLNQHLTQMLHRVQHPMPLSVESIALKNLWQEALQVLNQHKKAIKVITQHHTTCQILQADPQKIHRLLVHGLAYIASHQHDKQPLLLGFEDTQLAYPIMAMPGYVKHIMAIRISMTTAKELPPLKEWYLGSVDHAETTWPQGVAALPITYNQQIVEAHYGVTETLPQLDGVTLEYVIPQNVRAIRPSIMDQWQGDPTKANQKLPEYPSEKSLVKAVLNQTHMDATLLKHALQFSKQHHSKNQRDTRETYYLHAIAVAHIVLGYTHDLNALLAALMHNILDKTHCSLHQIALCFNPVVQRIVEGVARVDSRLRSCKKLQLSHQEALRKSLANDDDRVLYIKLADRLHNMRTIERHTSLAKRQKIAEETLQCFVPIADKMGLKNAAKELKKLCLAVLHNN